MALQSGPTALEESWQTPLRAVRAIRKGLVQQKVHAFLSHCQRTQQRGCRRRPKRLMGLVRGSMHGSRSSCLQRLPDHHAGSHVWRHD